MPSIHVDWIIAAAGAFFALPVLLVLSFLIINVVSSGGSTQNLLLAPQARLLRRVKREWLRTSRQAILFRPVGVICCGSRPPYGQPPTRGVLGIVNEHLVFVGLRDSYNIDLPIQAVRWVRLRRIAFPLVSAGARNTLLIHADGPDGWVVYAFILDEAREFARCLNLLTNVPVQDVDAAREDYGPAEATRLTEDIYGQWAMDRRDTLYLAPDRLLLGWHDPLYLSRVRKLDVLSKEGLGNLNPFAEDLLRIEHENPGGRRQVTGFLVRHADQWAEAIQALTQAPLEYQAGRKKKEGAK